jgi:hypothetical protein
MSNSQTTNERIVMYLATLVAQPLCAFQVDLAVTECDAAIQRCAVRCARYRPCLRAVNSPLWISLPLIAGAKFPMNLGKALSRRLFRFPH